MEVLAGFGVDLLNVHAAGGKAMMEAALEGLDKGTPAGLRRPALIGVTQLTSTDERQVQEEQLIKTSLQDSVLHYAQLTKSAGLDGVVCSVHESSAIANVCGPEFFKVTPGIRLAKAERMIRNELRRQKKHVLRDLHISLLAGQLRGRTIRVLHTRQSIDNGKGQNDDGEKSSTNSFKRRCRRIKSK